MVCVRYNKYMKCNVFFAVQQPQRFIHSSEKALLLKRIELERTGRPALWLVTSALQRIA